MAGFHTKETTLIVVELPAAGLATGLVMEYMVFLITGFA